MIAKLIQKAVTANKELVDALEKLSEVLGVTTNGVSVFEGEHLRLSRPTETPAESIGKDKAISHIPEPKQKRKTGQAGLKNRAEGASINAAEDPAIWPFETNRYKVEREPSLTIQKQVKEIVAASGSAGIIRREINSHIGQVLPAHMKRKANKAGFKAWKASLGNLLRNYAAAGYLNCEAQDTNRNNDLFTLGG